MRLLTMILLLGRLALPLSAAGQVLALSGDVLVASNSRLLRVEPTLPRVTQLIESQVRDLAFDPDGNLVLLSNVGVSRLDLESGQIVPIGGAGILGNPNSVVVDESGDIFFVVSGNRNQLVKVDPDTGGTTVLFDQLDRVLLPERIQPTGMVIDPSGGFLVGLRGRFASDLDAVVHLDPVSGAMEVVSSGGLLEDPWGLAWAPDGGLLVADQRAGLILRIDVATGEQSVVVASGLLSSPYDLAFSADGRLYVSELSSRVPGEGTQILEIHPTTGLQRLLGFSETGGIAVVPGNAAPPACRDGLDNDGDRRRDFPRDPGCSGPEDGTEEPICADGLDNDLDGLVDFGADPGCAGANARAQEAPQCDDGRDNDGDGFFDHPDDPQCVSRSDNTEHRLPRRRRFWLFR